MSQAPKVSKMLPVTMQRCLLSRASRATGDRRFGKSCQETAKIATATQKAGTNAPA